MFANVWLWIAFRIVSLHYRSQRPKTFRPHYHGCELLSESYLCIIVHNFHFLTHSRRKLWIAFRIVSLHYRSQRNSLPPSSCVCCELLSESYLCIIVHNYIDGLTFHFVLWIAFRIVSLHYRSQRNFFLCHNCCGCELLSESYLCIIVHNKFRGQPIGKRVVNCFQNRIFALSFTTVRLEVCFAIPLWIAFRIVSLHYRSQHKVRTLWSSWSCELLSESYLCIIVHNPIVQSFSVLTVVNCFQNRIFALSFTTK